MLQTDRRQTDGFTTTHSEREHEFIIAKKVFEKTLIIFKWIQIIHYSNKILSAGLDSTDTFIIAYPLYYVNNLHIKQNDL